MVLVKVENHSSSLNDEDSIFDENTLSFRNIYNLLERRKKIFLILVLTIFTTSLGNLIFKRLARPIYRGSFTVMISDPFVGDRKSADGGFTLENVALNQNKSDVPTLISYLKSPKLLEIIAQKHNYHS